MFWYNTIYIIFFCEKFKNKRKIAKLFLGKKLQAMQKVPTHHQHPFHNFSGWPPPPHQKPSQDLVKCFELHFSSKISFPRVTYFLFLLLVIFCYFCTFCTFWKIWWIYYCLIRKIMGIATKQPCSCKECVFSSSCYRVEYLIGGKKPG